MTKKITFSLLAAICTWWWHGFSIFCFGTKRASPSWPFPESPQRYSLSRACRFQTPIEAGPVIQQNVLCVNKWFNLGFNSYYEISLTLMQLALKFVYKNSKCNHIIYLQLNNDTKNTPFGTGIMEQCVKNISVQYNLTGTLFQRFWILFSVLLCILRIEKNSIFKQRHLLAFI